jgi:glutamine amidotransferase
MTTLVIDHGRANLYSLTHALAHLGIEHVVSSEPSAIAAASRLVLPGVGAFGDVMKAISERGLVVPLLAAVARKVPTLGICVGMQVLADESEEFGIHKGLGLIPGAVRRLPDPPADMRALRVPNVGWRTLQARPGAPVFGDLPTQTMAYFVHSYAFEAADANDVVATIDFNGRPVTAVVSRDNLMGFQFHPEKSGADGLSLIRRFFTMFTGA